MLLRLIPEEAWHSHVHYALIRTARTESVQYENWKWPTGLGGYSDEGASLLERNIAHYCDIQMTFMLLLRARYTTVINLKAASGWSLNPSEPSKQEASVTQKLLLKIMEYSRLACNLAIRITCQYTWCHLGQTSSRLVHIHVHVQTFQLDHWQIWGFPNQQKTKTRRLVPIKPGDVLFSTLITHDMHPLTVIGVSHLSCENQSYQKVVLRTDFGYQKWSPWTTSGCQKWSRLAKTGSCRIKFRKPNWSRGPLLAAESGPLDHRYRTQNTIGNKSRARIDPTYWPARAIRVCAN